MTAFRHPEALVATGWLEDHLADPDLRVFDCTTYLAYEEGTGRPYTVVSGESDFDEGHVPGSGHLDLQAEFSRADSPYSFTLPAPETAGAAFARRGVGDGTRVVLYSRGTPQWATRFWWMLRWLGFDAAAVLDGGWEKWAAEGRPVSTAPCAYAPATLTVAPRPGVFTGKDEVLAGIGAPGVCTINALAPDLHSGANPRYGRPGHVPGSVNAPVASLLDPATRTVRPPEEVAAAFAAIGARPDQRIIAYCGGGIAATFDAFLLHQLGYDDVAVYDASMSEWAKDERLPIETD